MGINFTAIEEIFRNAENDFLLEHEVYAVLQAAGLPAPKFLFIPREKKVAFQDLSSFPGEKVVVKVISPQIQHKSDVGGVRFSAKEVEDVNQVISAMLVEIPPRFQKWIEGIETPEVQTGLSREDIEDSIKGTLIIEAVDFPNLGFGSELMLGLRASREFGPIVSMGSGGLDVEYLNARIKEDQAVVISSSHLFEKEKIRDVLSPLAFYEKLTSSFRGRSPLVEKETLEDVYHVFLRLGAHFSPYTDNSEFVVEEAEVNPLVIKDGQLIPLDGLCRISHNYNKPGLRPFKYIRNLLKPHSIGIIGVSEKMNIGHLILNNILKGGFPRDKVYIIKPGRKEIEGCRCVNTVADMPEVVDMFVLTVAADQSYQIIQEIIEHEKARSLIIISGGIGEKKGTKHLENDIKALLSRGREQGKLVPVVNGGNCIGIFSRPGQYDTTFVPEHKRFRLPRQDVKKSPLVYLSQSGAFMISRMSQIPQIDPLYAVSIGNQIDLSVSDYLSHLKDDPDARIFAVYIEGFLPADGMAFARVAQEICRQPGKTVLVYKAGRSPEGRAATASHTASVAGDYQVSRSILKQAGVLVAESVREFENYIKALCFLENKRIEGNGIGLISNAGFECVIMSDNLENGEKLHLAEYTPGTVKSLKEILSPLGIDRLQDIRNPLDLTPIADDKTFCEAAEVILSDENVDAAVISPLPMTSTMQSLPPSPNHQEDLNREGSLLGRLITLFKKSVKPFVLCIDAGEIYQPLVDLLEKAGIPVFRRSDEAVIFIRKYIHHFLRAKAGRV